MDKALKHLARDAHLKALIKKYPPPAYRRRRNVFEALAKAIVYQQLSGKAAATIYGRFAAACTAAPTPQVVSRITVAKLRACGLSGQKASYLKDLAAKFLDGTIEPKKFNNMSDEEIRNHVVAVKGIGPWTADMFLMFTLNRPDVLPTGDLGIQKGFQKLYSLKRLPTPEAMERLAASWRPYRTYASWYLWRLADDGNPSRPTTNA